MLDLVTSRRTLLKVGSLGLGGLALPNLLRCEAAAAQAAGERPRRKAVILLWLAGGPRHIDMYDLKPDAPAEFRGEFKPIASNVDRSVMRRLETRSVAGDGCCDEGAASGPTVNSATRVARVSAFMATSWHELSSQPDRG